MPLLVHEVHGPEGAPTALFSSGLGGAAAFWRPLAEVLLAAGWRVITYDQRGTGRSGGRLTAPYRIADMAQDVLDLLDATGTASCHFIGHALGGLVGLELALTAPRRVDSLALVNAWSRPNPHSARCFDARLALLAAGGARAYCEAQPIFLYPAAWCADNARRVQDEVDHAVAHFPGEDNMRLRIGALRAFDVDERLAEVRVPTWVSAAQDDTLVPWTCSRRLAEGLPNASLHTLPHGGHAHSVTQADAFNQALMAFLATQADGKKRMTLPIDAAALATLFTEARSHNGWTPEPVSDELLRQVYELARMGPTSANCSPARFVFVRSPEGKQKLAPALSKGNLDKTLSAPVTVIAAWDTRFYDQLPTLFPHADARSWFTGSPEVAHETAFRNGTLQAGYLILAARALGLDAGPMSGFDKAKVDEAFFAGSHWSTNFLINLGHGDPAKLFGRLPRLAFDQACRFD